MDEEFICSECGINLKQNEIWYDEEHNSIYNEKAYLCHKCYLKLYWSMDGGIIYF